VVTISKGWWIAFVALLILSASPKFSYPAEAVVAASSEHVVTCESQSPQLLLRITPARLWMTPARAATASAAVERTATLASWSK
jgi:hypothetical protein